MDYEQKYKEALEKLRDFYRDYDTVSHLIDVKEELANLFPELKESENEKIRKSIINLVIKSAQNGEMALHKWESQQMLAWLEKQGEKDKPTYNTYSKDVQLTQEEFDKKRVSDEATIKEVEAYKKGLEDAQKIFEKQGEQKPTLEMKSAEESLGIDSDTYNEIVDECIYGEQKSQRMISAEAKEAMYDKPAWSEDDENRLSDAVFFVREYQIPTRDKRLLNAAKETEEWLKSLKERIGR